MNNLARQFADMYYGMRIETVPIPFGEKAPPVYGWMEKSHDELWANVGEKSNIGIIAGKNNVVILDPDNADSTKQLANYFQSLGIEHVGTRTRKGEHWWIRTSPPENYLYSSKKLHAPLVGDVRIRNGYALAEPSMVNDFKYELIGNPAKIPVVDWEVIFPLLNNCEESMDKRTEKDKTQADLDVIGLPIPLISKSYITPKLVGIQSSLFFTKKGESIQFEDQSWKSRSEAAYSLILSLVLRGVPAKEIASFVKLPDRNYQWVERSINNAIKAICDHQFRPKLAEYYHSPFPLTTSLPSTDYGTLLGILSLAWKLNRTELYLPIREIALLTSTSKTTACDSLKRLRDIGIISKTGEIIFDNHNNAIPSYILNTNLIDTILVNNGLNTPNVSYVPKTGLFPELWREDALGKKALNIFMTLNYEPKSYEDIRDITNIKRSSLYETIKVLTKNRLAINTGKKWIKGDANLEELEKEFQCFDSSRRRQISIEMERHKDDFIQYSILESTNESIDDELTSVSDNEGSFPFA